MFMYSAFHPDCDGDKGLVYHQLFRMTLISGSYFVCFCAKAWYGNLSWQYVNPMNWVVRTWEGDSGVCIWFKAHIMHRMSRLNLAWQWYVACVHVHLRSQFKIVWSVGMLLRLHALATVRNHMFLLACSV